MQMFEIYSLIMWSVLVFIGVVVALWHCLIDMAANSLFRIAEASSQGLTPLVDFEWWSSPRETSPAPRFSGTTGIRRHYTLHPSPHPTSKKHQRRYFRYRHWTRRLSPARHWGYLVVRFSGGMLKLKTVLPSFVR